MVTVRLRGCYYGSLAIEIDNASNNNVKLYSPNGSPPPLSILIPRITTISNLEGDSSCREHGGLGRDYREFLIPRSSRSVYLDMYLYLDRPSLFNASCVFSV